jgi:prepilin-type N-terminal cleavage/methylation domain-containing protein
MKNQKGFTLVELMVVLAIIAILSTAGISQYGRFIKSARDTTRLSDLQALNVVLLDSIQANWVVPSEMGDWSDTDTGSLKQKIKEVAGKEISDKVADGACLDEDGNSTDCGYYYASCDGGTGYVIATTFESENNIRKYTEDDRGGKQAGDDRKFEIGTCNTIDWALEEIEASGV